MASNGEGTLKEIEQQLLDTVQERQSSLAEEIGRIRSELEEMLGLSMPIELSDGLLDEIQKLATVVGKRTSKPQPKPKEGYSGKNISTEQKEAFVQEILERGPLSKKEMLDKAGDKFVRTPAPTFLDTAIKACEEEGLIEETGDKKGRSIVYSVK